MATNNERVISRRASRMGLSQDQYKKKFPKGYDPVKEKIDAEKTEKSAGSK